MHQLVYPQRGHDATAPARPGGPHLRPKTAAIDIDDPCVAQRSHLRPPSPKQKVPWLLSELHLGAALPHDLDGGLTEATCQGAERIGDPGSQHKYRPPRCPPSTTSVLSRIGRSTGPPRSPPNSKAVRLPSHSYAFYLIAHGSCAISTVGPMAWELGQRSLTFSSAQSGEVHSPGLKADKDKCHSPQLLYVQGQARPHVGFISLRWSRRRTSGVSWS